MNPRIGKYAILVRLLILWSMLDDSWEFNDYTYMSVGGGQSRPVLTTPAPGAILSGASATFGWTAGVGVTEYWLYVGSTTGASDLYNASTGTNVAAALNNLPTDGSTLYVRLWSKVASGWRFNDYTYSGALRCPCPRMAEGQAAPLRG